MLEPIVLLARIVVGSFFLVAGIAKWRLGAHSFAQAIQGSRLLPADLTVVVARALPFVEMAIGASLLVATAPGATALCATALLTLFATAMASALARGLVPGCGCSAFVREQRVSWRLVYRNLGLRALMGPVASGSPLALTGTLAIVLSATTLLFAVHLFSRH